jgi:hypothetical protein
METKGPVSAGEASAALAAAKQARARVAWSGYPAWYWLLTGAGLGVLCYAALLPSWWGLAIAPVAGMTLFLVARAANRVRGVRERCQRGAMTVRDRVILSGPAALAMLVGAAAVKLISWPLAVPAVLAGMMFAGTGLILSARAGRP